MTSTGASVARLMAGLGVQTTIVLVLALAAVAAARKRPAAFRHLILSAALAGLLLLPLCGLGPLGWRSPLVPRWVSAGAAAPRGTPSTERTAALELRPVPFPLVTTSGPGPEPPGTGSASSDGREPLAASAPRALENPAPAASAEDPAAPSSKRGGSGAFALGTILSGVWAAGVLVLLLRLAFGLAGAVRLTAQGTPLEGRVWRALVDRFLSLVSLRRPVLLRSHPAVAVPLTWGWRKPVILLPDGTEDWSEDERSSALFHELSHIKRADFVSMLLVRASLAAFWWNPLCWLVYRELRKEQEIACDELALRAGIRPSAYAASLLAFRRSAGLRWDPSAALLGFAGRSSLETRLTAVLGQKTLFKEVKMKTKLMVVLSLTAAVALIGTARPADGREAAAPRTVLAETVLPAPALSEAALTAPATAETAAAPAIGQEKAKEAGKAEREKTSGKPIVVVTGKGEKTPVVITITEGGKVRTLRLDNTVTITKGKDDEIVVTVEGKEPIVLKGEPLKLEIKGGRLEVVGEHTVVKPGESGNVEILKKDGPTIVFVGPEGIVRQGRRLAIAGGEENEEAPGEIIVKRVEEIKPGEKWVGKEGAPEGAWTVVEGGKGKSAWVVKEGPGKGEGLTWVGEGGRTFALSSEADRKMLDKIRELEKQVEAIKAKKMDLSALEDSLKKIEAELQARDKELKGITAKIGREPGEIEIIRAPRGDKDVAVYVFDMEKAAAGKGAAFVKVESGDKAPITLVFGRKGLTRADFDRATAELKKALPEGYKLSSSDFEEEDGSMHFTIAPPQGTPVDQALVKKLVKSLEESAAKK
jgi:beta-lactamase regulating signal transducer with metallopeptidase domain